MNNINNYFHLYLLAVELIGSICFFLGFFPTKISTNLCSSMDELPDINRTDLDKLITYDNHFNKTVIMVIDALRYDFVNTSSDNIFFPYLSSQLIKENSCLLEAKVNSPTVTLPRLKSLLTGTVPGFLDILTNFGKAELNIDNFITQAQKKGYRAVFYGDETWLNLLPRQFLRSEGTTSFYVSDYTEVDLNVTRNVKVELNRGDWDLMILHYLGLDHIGHLEGPRSNLIKPKLLEMDAVISLIHSSLLQTTASSLLIICGDHGMKDSGGHGGTSSSEVLVPVAILNIGCNSNSFEKKINQIDLAPLLSIFLGLPIPAESVGKLNYEILSGLNQHHSLYALLYNSLRLSKKCAMNNINVTNLGINESIEKGIKYFNHFLFNHSYIDYLNSAKYFSNVQDLMSKKLVGLSVNYDLPLMIIGMLHLLQSCSASILGKFIYSVRRMQYLLICNLTFLVFHYLLCYFSESDSITCGIVSFAPLFTILKYLIIIINLFLIKYTKICISNFSNIRKFLCVGTILLVISLTSSSYIEEEHQLWYFLCVTLLLVFIKNDIIGCSLLLICHRFLRYLNQTGDKWASLPDVGDWLMDSNRVVYIILFYSFGVILTCIFLIYSSSERIDSHFFTIGQYLFAFLYKITSGNFKLGEFYSSQSTGIVLCRCFWIITLLKTISFFRMLKLKRRKKYLANSLCKLMIEFLLENTTALVCLLCKPHNVVLIPSLMFYSHFAVKHFKNDTFSLIFLHYWLGTLFYFYQGNSNSISSIDISPGYVGLENYNFYITGFYIALNTFSSHVIAFLLMIRTLAKREELIENLAKICYTSILMYGTQITVYSVIITMQRHHLFIWSVFAPKLMYILSHILVNASLICISFSFSLIGTLLSDASKHLKD